ncbi:hypothetical protein Acr_21g0000650 [Actinidia rufa]|uniref:Uncharacterized protein n=1 Tax=Actinidia rufa TaxID=165716 RepID=A0A7J0GF90_9ERIC|nr:hypothetical protein Acr_21g0000650 [Actinidia rufa]
MHLILFRVHMQITGTPHADNLFQSKSTYTFDSVPSTPQDLFQQKSTFAFDSVPSTPMYNFSNSPRRFSEGSEEHAFGSFSRFDSFNTHDSGFFPPGGVPHETLKLVKGSFNLGTMVGLILSVAQKTLMIPVVSNLFDDMDPFGSTGPFKTSLESQTPRRDSDNWRAF